MPPSAPHDAPRPRFPCAAVWIGALVVAAMYAAFPLDRHFSDSLLCVTRVDAGPLPYYNVAYVPLGWAFHRTVGALAGWDVQRALEVFSALALAAAAALAFVWMRRAGVRPWIAAAWTLVIAASPGFALHSAVVEVHALQAAGALVAILLADGASVAAPGRAWIRVGGASAIAVLAHLTHVLLVPGLVLLALPRAPGRGLRFTARHVRLAVSVALTVGAVVAILQITAVQQALPRGAWLWAYMLVFFARTLVGGWGEYGLRTLPEAADYLRAEFVGPAGALIVGPVLALLAWRFFDVDARRRVARALALPLLAVLLFSQGGIWERGGYFLTYLPSLAFAGAAASEAVLARSRPIAALAPLALVLFAQSVSVDRERAALIAEGPEPRAWADRVANALAPGDRVLVASLAKSLALEARRSDVLAPDLARQIDMAPRRHALAAAYAQLAATLTAPDRSGAVYLDEALWRGRSSKAMEQLAAHPRLRLTPLEGLPADHELLRVDIVPAGE